MESQSRYSIIERMLSRKLDIMTAKTNLIDDIKKAEQRATTLESDVGHDKKVYQQEADKQKDEADKLVRDAKQNVTNLKDRKEAKEKLYDDKIKDINDALKQLEEISKSSASQS